MEYSESRDRMGYGKSMGKNSRELQSHKVVISGRTQGIISGVLDVTEFDNNMIDLDTSLGRLLIKGKDLKVKGLNLEKGEAEIEGNVDSLTYAARQNNEPLIKRLFK